MEHLSGEPVAVKKAIAITDDEHVVTVVQSNLNPRKKKLKATFRMPSTRPPAHSFMARIVRQL